MYIADLMPFIFAPMAFELLLRDVQLANRGCPIPVRPLASALFLLATTARKLGDRRCQCLFAFVTVLNSVHGLICIIHTSLETRRRHTPILGPHFLYISTY